jgi:hypothetical protein
MGAVFLCAPAAWNYPAEKFRWDNWITLSRSSASPGYANNQRENLQLAASERKMSEAIQTTEEQTKRTLELKEARQRAIDAGLSPAYSVIEAAHILNIGITNLYAERKAKRLRVCNIGARSVVFADDLAAYQALLKSEADARPVKSPQAA